MIRKEREMEGMVRMTDARRGVGGGREACESLSYTAQEARVIKRMTH
jgi:hypothetical protein